MINSFFIYFNFLIQFYLRSFRKVKIGVNVFLVPKIKISAHKNLWIGNHIYIGPNSSLYSEGKIIINDGSIIGPNVTIYSTNHKYKNRIMLPYEKRADLKKVIIGKGCWIGDSVMIAPGTIIGDGCIVAMGSVCFGVYPKGSLIMGNPAKVVKKLLNENISDLISKESYYMVSK